MEGAAIRFRGFTGPASACGGIVCRNLLCRSPIARRWCRKQAATAVSVQTGAEPGRRDTPAPADNTGFRIDSGARHAHTAGVGIPGQRPA